MRDPDHTALDGATAMLRQSLKDMGVSGVSATQAKTIAHAMICTFITERARAWAEHRGIMPIGEPDANDVGFAKASLKQVRAKAREHGLPLAAAIGDWKATEVATFLAIGWHAIADTREHTLSDPSSEIPF